MVGKQGMTTTWLILTILGVAAIAGGAFYWAYLGNSPAGGGLFGPRPERRLSVVEQANVDGRRRLILIRRDGVEHLIMTGGPIDVVVETGIGAPAPATSPAATSGLPRVRPALAASTDGDGVREPTLVARPPRRLNPVAGE
jgi:hypothetical protein